MVLFFTGMMALVMFSACHANNNAEPSPQPDNKLTAAELNAEIIKKRNETVDRAVVEELQKRDNLPPIGSSHMEVVSTNDRISIEDAERSYLFRKSAIEHCYLIALARDESAKGFVGLTMKRDSGTEKAVLDKMETDIKTEKFEECVTNAVDRWPLPEGAQITVKIHFSSKPAPSVEELQKLRNGHHH